MKIDHVVLRSIQTALGETEKEKRAMETVGDLPPVGFTPCSNLREDYSFFHHSFLFIYSISKFISNSPEGGNKISSQTHKYCQSEWITTAGQVVSESRRRSGKKVITVTRRRQSRPQIISISHMELKIVLCHIVFPHTLSKTGFRYANYVWRGWEEKKKSRNCKRREEKENTQPRGWHPGASLCHAGWFLRELDGF